MGALQFSEFHPSNTTVDKAAEGLLTSSACSAVLAVMLAGHAEFPVRRLHHCDSPGLRCGMDTLGAPELEHRCRLDWPGVVVLGTKSRVEGSGYAGNGRGRVVFCHVGCVVDVESHAAEGWRRGSAMAP